MFASRLSESIIQILSEYDIGNDYHYDPSDIAEDIIGAVVDFNASLWTPGTGRHRGEHQGDYHGE